LSQLIARAFELGMRRAVVNATVTRSAKEE